MAKAQQLPSGSWRVRVYDSETGKRISFTSSLPGKAGKAEAELMAREYQLGIRKKKEQGKSVGECIDEYISLKENILSPTTVSEYRRCRCGELAELCDIPVKALTQQMIQQHINKLALSLRPKTVRNAHGLLASVLAVYVPELRLHTTLPKVQKSFKQLPPAEDVLRAIIDSSVELPCLLAMWCSLRMSEVRGLRRSDIKDGIVTIHSTKVRVNNEDVVKESTKTIDSTRRIALPQRIQDLISALPAEQEYLVPLTGQALYKRFSKLLERKGIDHMSFHDLRHMNASIMLALGIPDKYAMERGGWSSPAVMKSVYQHTFTAERQAADAKIDGYFNSLLDTILDTDSD